MRELIERIECATGPSRELDAEIIKLVSRGILDGEYWTLPAYTASLDAAMTLVPEGCITSLTHEQRWKKPRWTWGLNDGGGVTHFGTAETPALALVAAALKARGE